MSYPKGTIWYAKDKHERAKELGWADYDSSIFDLYCHEELSFRQTGRWFSTTDQAIKERLKNTPGFMPRSRGGKNHRAKPWDKKWRQGEVRP